MRCRLYFFYSATLSPLRWEIQDGRLDSGPDFATKWLKAMSNSFTLCLAVCSWLGVGWGEKGRAGALAMYLNVASSVCSLTDFHVLT